MALVGYKDCTGRSTLWSAIQSDARSHESVRTWKRTFGN